jgi:hypothetical protein
VVESRGYLPPSALRREDHQIPEVVMLFRTRRSVMRLAAQSQQRDTAAGSSRPHAGPREADEVVRPFDLRRAAAMSETRPDVADELLHLMELYEAGVLSLDEFTAAKTRILEV